MDRRAFLQTLFIGAALAGSKPLRAVAAATYPQWKAVSKNIDGVLTYEHLVLAKRLSDERGDRWYPYDQRESDNGQTWVIAGQSNMTVQRGQSDAQAPAPPSGLNRHERRRAAAVARS